MDKFYYELTITPNSHYDLYIDLILNITTQAIEETNNTIIIRSEETLNDIQEGVEAFTDALQKNLDSNIICNITLEQKANEDWIENYKNSIKPIEVGKFYIHPSWIAEKLDKINISIDPALTFGSGHHETTNSCLEAISQYVQPSHKIIDVGCGSGILSIAAAKLGAMCDICDTDPLAVEDSIKNSKANNVKFANSWVGSATQTSQQYDIVIANIVADVLIMIHKDLKKILKENGILILSGILTVYEDKVLNKFIKNNECKVVQIIHKNEWTTLILQKDKINE